MSCSDVVVRRRGATAYAASVIDDPAPDGADRPGNDYLGFVPTAVDAVTRRLPHVDPVAMELVLLLHRVGNTVVADIEAGVHRPAGWSFPGFRLLFTLWVSGPLGVSRLAELSGVSRAALSTLAQRLERDGLVQREPSDSDARSVTVTLTDEGQRRLATTFAHHNAREQLWSDRLDPGEQQELIRLLGKLGGADLPPLLSTH